jgi:hypothetical protein
MSDIQESQNDKEARDVPDEPKRTESSAQPDIIAPPLASLIGSVRAALTRGASAELRAAGATACRSILTVLEAKPGQPLAVAPSLAVAPPPVSSNSSLV